jgi:FtsP/CotA-like multicopper oxidase with cupredoxin domain
MRIHKSLASAALLGGALASGASAKIDGMEGTSFTLNLGETFISTAEGGAVYMWGCDPGTGVVQYPCPTLIVNEGADVQITINYAFRPGEGPEVVQGADPSVGLVFPGQTGVSATGGRAGVLTQEATQSSSVTYNFTAESPGTFMYHGGSDIAYEMGLVGALIVESTETDPDSGKPTAYGHPDTAYDYENLFLLTDIDSRVHDAIFFGQQPDMSARFANYFMINGRTGLDTVLDSDLVWLPSQPYSALVRTRPQETVLMRVIGAGLDMHPFHHHGNHAMQIAHDGRLLTSTPDTPAPDLAVGDFTMQVSPGKTYDALWTWTGEGLGWDVYGKGPGDACDAQFQICPVDPTCDPTLDVCLDAEGRVSDHGKPFPLTLPDVTQLTLGAYWSGTQFLGGNPALPTGEGGYNINAGMYYMWHSHTEKELTNFNIYPGGMMTMMVVEPPFVTDIE